MTTPAYLTEANRRHAEFVRETATPAVGSWICYDGGNALGTALTEGDSFVDSGFAGCDFRTKHGTAINVEVTGRTFQYRNGSRMVRVRIEFVGDCEPSTFTGGWMAVNN